MLMPKRVKYRKQFRGRMRGKAKGATALQNGEFGMQALEPGWITSRQIETVRRVVVRHMKRRGKVWIRIFPDKPVTAMDIAVAFKNSLLLCNSFFTNVPFSYLF